MADQDRSDPEFASAEARLEADIIRALDAAEAGADDETAWHRVGRITEILRRGMTISGDRRAAIGARIRDAGKLSLAGLAHKVGISKARAQEIADRAKGRRT